MPGRFTPDAVKSQLAKSQLEPLYLLTGEDGAEMVDLISAFTEAIEEDLRAFNVHHFFGNDPGLKLAMVLDAAGSLPMLAPRRMVILSQAEKLLSGRKNQETDEDGGESGDGEEAGKGSRALALLKEYAKSPFGHATVVIAGSGQLLRSFDALSKVACLVICEPRVDVVEQMTREHGVRLDRDAAELLRQRAGGDLARLRAELERVLLYAAGHGRVTREHVEEVVARQSAIGGRALWDEVTRRNAPRALRELKLQLEAGAVSFMILGLLRSIVEKTVGDRDLPRAIDALLRTDTALKTSSGDKRESERLVLERLVVEICGMQVAGRAGR